MAPNIGNNYRYVPKYLFIISKQSVKVITQLINLIIYFNNCQNTRKLYFIGGLISFIAGLLISWPSPSIPILIDQNGPYSFTLEQCSYLTVIPPITCIISSFFYARIIDVIGRKYTVLFMTGPYIVSFILIAVADNIYLLYLSRAISGIADGGLFSAFPAYIGEITTPKIRGTWGNCLALYLYIGEAIINVIGGYTSIKTCAWICLIFPVLFLCTYSFMPETPYYLVMKGKTEEARNVLHKLKRTDNIETELQQLQMDVNRQMSELGTWRDLFVIKSNRRALTAGTFLRFSQQLSGISCFAVYTQYIFKQAGGNVTATESAVIFQTTLAIATFVCSVFSDKIGRRSSMAVSLLTSAVVIGAVTIFFYILKEHPEIDISNFTWIPLAGMILYVITYSVGLGIVPTLMLGELFSASIKGKGLAVLTIVLSITVSVMTKVFQVMEVNFGMYAPFALFSVCCFVNTFFTYYFVPETKGKTLEEIQQELKGNKNTK